MKRILSIFLSTCILLMSFSYTLANNDSQNGNAGAVGGKTIESIIGTGETKPLDDGNVVSSILGFLQWFGYAVAIGMLIYIGIKYVMAPANDRAVLKDALIKYTMGAILIAGASTVIKIITSIG